jgi:FkbM family methyltransferase
MKSTFRIEAISNKRDNLEKRYLLFPNDNAVTSTLLNNTLYEPWIYQFLVDNNLDISGSNVVDIGANNGQITVEFANLVGDNGKVFSFEPQRIIYYQLCGNVFFNGLDNVHCFNVALGDNEGFISIEKPNYFDKGPVNFGNIHVGVEENYELVQLHKLDSYNIENISIIKIDVQGYEKRVLLGAKETIMKNRPIIYIEIEEDQLQNYGEDENSVVNLLNDYGYFTKRFNEGISFQTVSGLCLDFVAIPNELYNSREWIIK